MVFLNPWLLLVWLLLGAGVAWAYMKGWLRVGSGRRGAVKVAHSGRITRLPQYEKVAKRYRLWLIVMSTMLVIATLSSVILSARPAEQSLVTPAQFNRDIMLCLDVSGSMLNTDIQLVETFEQLINSFKGQRIGLEMFNVAGSPVVSLTDDYDTLRERLAYTKEMLKLLQDSSEISNSKWSEMHAFFAGAEVSVKGAHLPSSNVGLGLASCVEHMGMNTNSRSQSVILATDNELGGPPSAAIISTKQAMALAKQRSVRVYALDPGVFNEDTMRSEPNVPDNHLGEHAELKTYSILTSGAYYRLSEKNIVPSIIEQISKQEATLFTGDSQYTVNDAPLAPFVVLVVAVAGLMVIAWRLRL